MAEALGAGTLLPKRQTSFFPEPLVGEGAWPAVAALIWPAALPSPGLHLAMK